MAKKRTLVEDANMVRQQEYETLKFRAENEKGGLDGPLILTVLLLVAFGLLMLYSASSYNAQLKFGSSFWYVNQQLKTTLIGLAVMVLFMFIPPYRFWKPLSVIGYIGAIISIMLIMVPSLAVEANGAKRWLNLGGFTIQPAEVVKVGVILAMAAYIAKFAKKLNNWMVYTVGFALCAIGAGLTAVLTDDLGTAIIILAIGFVTMLLACPEKKFLIITAIVLIAGGVILVAMRPYRMLRVKAWLDLEAYSQDESYQIVQALYAIGSGGLFGKGLGKSTQKMGFVPESQNDMIFSIICEELGIVGAIILLVLFGILLWRLLKIYQRTDDLFGRMIIAGVASHIAVQTILNLAVVTSLVPNTGVPLPFISYGGSAIIMLLGEIGIVLCISRTRTKPKTVAARSGHNNNKKMVYDQ